MASTQTPTSRIPLPSGLNKTGVFNLVPTVLILTLSPNGATPSRSWWLGISLLSLMIIIVAQLYTATHRNPPAGVNSDGNLEDAAKLRASLKTTLGPDVFCTIGTLLALVEPLKLLKSLPSAQGLIATISNPMYEKAPLLRGIFTHPIICIVIIIAISSYLKSVIGSRTDDATAIGTLSNACNSLVVFSVSDLCRAYTPLLKGQA